MNQLMQKIVARDWKPRARAFPVIGMLGAAALLPLGAPAAGIGGNLMQNGTFDEGLKGWRYQYNQFQGESWYADNNEFVSIVDRLDGRVNVLSLKASLAKAWAPGQGVKVDSFPIPVDTKGGLAKYKLTVSARSTAPNCRILLEGYKWKPGIKPHDNPEWHELRRVYKFAQVYFTGSGGGHGAAKGVESKNSGSLQGKKAAVEDDEGSGDFGGVKKSWDTATMTFPDPKMTDLAKGMYEQVKFVMLHVVAIGNIIGVDEYRKRDDTYLYVDDVKLERIK